MLAGAVRASLQPRLQEYLRYVPQYAFLPGRSTSDSLLRAFAHIQAVTSQLQGQSRSLFARQSGQQTYKVRGGIMLSLDLSRAFDTASRLHLSQALVDMGVPPGEIARVEALHREAEYHIRHAGIKGSVRPSRGIRQGCRLSPAL